MTLAWDGIAAAVLTMTSEESRNLVDMMDSLPEIDINVPPGKTAKVTVEFLFCYRCA